MRLLAITCVSGVLLVALFIGSLEAKYKQAGAVILRKSWWLLTKPPLPVDSLQGYEARAAATLQEFRPPKHGGVSLQSDTHAHVWGLKDIPGAKLDLTHYVHILHVDEAALYADVEGRALFTDVIQYLLEKHHMALEVIPDMAHLTIGGLYAGVGGGAATFRYGALHHSVMEVDVLTASGKVITCSPTRHADWFAILPGSLGTFGYVLRFRLRIKRAGRYVLAKHVRLDGASTLMKNFEEHMSTSDMIDFMDGAIYSANESVLITGRMTDDLPMGATFYSLRKTGIPYAMMARDGHDLWFELIDFIFRWDPDGYFSTWESPEWTRDPTLRAWLAALFPAFHRSDWLREIFSIMWGFDLKKPGSHMCVDYVVPLAVSARSLEWYDREVGVYPLYMAPISVASPPSAEYVLWNPPLPAVDIGVGYGPMGNVRGKRQTLRMRKKMEQYLGKVEGGTRLMYTNIDLSDLKEFWSLFPPGAQERYSSAKAEHDPDGVFLHIEQKLGGGEQAASTGAGEFALQNVLTGRYLNLWEGRSEDGADVGTWTDDDDPSLWLINSTSGETTTIVNYAVASNLCLWDDGGIAVKACSSERGTRSQWKLLEQGDGAFAIQHVQAKTYLTYTGDFMADGEFAVVGAAVTPASSWRLVAFEL